MILLWDSADKTVSLRVIDGELDEIYEWRADRELAKKMHAFLRDTLAAHGRAFEDIKGIGVYQGPGSFTGLRIGLVVMNTLADALHIPIVGASSDDWQQDAVDRLNKGENDRIVMPEYGSEAHITSPRK